MTLYEFKCEKCKTLWEKEAPMLKAPKRAKCPKCKKQRERYYSSSPNLHFKGMDFHTNRRKAQVFHKKGASKDDALKYYNDSIRATRKRLEDTTSPYSRMDFTHETAKKFGAKRVSDVETKRKVELAKKLTRETNMNHSYYKNKKKKL
jgi:putative FmdB family regulatory protein